MVGPEGRSAQGLRAQSGQEPAACIGLCCTVCSCHVSVGTLANLSTLGFPSGETEVMAGNLTGLSLKNTYYENF